MKDKEKQIEEMAKELKELAKTIRTVLEDRTDIKYIPDLDFPIAKEILKHYQPKLSEDSVVLTEKERISMCVEQWDKGYNQGSKETAEKIFAKIDEELAECTIVNEGGYGWNYQGYEATDLRKRLTKLAKQFGVEIKE